MQTYTVYYSGKDFGLCAIEAFNCNNFKEIIPVINSIGEKLAKDLKQTITLKIAEW